MRRYRTFLIIAFAFIAVSALTYLLHYVIFRDVRHIFIYMVGDLAFLPLEVFLVVIVIERILTRREKQAIRQKLNMVVGAFYSEVGTQLLENLVNCFMTSSETRQQLAVNQKWTKSDFEKAAVFARSLKGQPQCLEAYLDGIRAFLIEKRTFLLGLLENPSLLLKANYPFLFSLIVRTHPFQESPSATVSG